MIQAALHTAFGILRNVRDDTLAEIGFDAQWNQLFNEAFWLPLFVLLVLAADCYREDVVHQILAQLGVARS